MAGTGQEGVCAAPVAELVYNVCAIHGGGNGGIHSWEHLDGRTWLELLEEHNCKHIARSHWLLVAHCSQ